MAGFSACELLDFTYASDGLKICRQKSDFSLTKLLVMKAKIAQIVLAGALAMVANDKTVTQFSLPLHQG